MLKKEFQRKDVERMRNLIKGKSDDSAEIQVGYSKKTKDHEEGETWVEDGRTWTIKNGIRQNVTRLDKIKKKANLPLFCPECEKVMKTQTDPKMYKIHGKCTSCVVEMEHLLRIDGKYEEYERKMIAANAESYADLMESYLLDAINSSNEGYVSEDGDVERWVGGVDKEDATQEVKEALDHFRKHIVEYATGETKDGRTTNKSKGDTLEDNRTPEE